MRDIPGFEGRYAATTDGRIWSHISEQFMTNIDARGYHKVSMSDKNRLVHRLVAATFLPNPENKRTVNHKNGIKADNRVENLEWATHKENINHAIDTGLRVAPVGEEAGPSFLTESQVISIRERYTAGESSTALAVEFETCRANILAVVKGQNWKHLPVADGIRELTKFRAAEATRSLSPERVRSLRLKHRAGRSIRGLAVDEGLPYSTVNSIVNFRTYATFDADLRKAA